MATQTGGSTINLDQIVIQSACPMDWDLMSGDERVRFCSKCGKHVYNFAELTRQQATDLIVGHGERLCGRIFRRPDGTIVTAPCPAESTKRSRPYQFTIASLIFLITSSAALFASMPLIGQVVGPVVEKWLAKPASPTPQTFTVGMIEMGDVDCIYEMPIDVEP